MADLILQMTDIGNTKIGLGEISDPEIIGNDIYPKETLLVRHIDCGDWIIKGDGTKVQVL